LNVIGGLMTKCNKPEKAAQFLSEAEQLFQDLVRSLPASQLFRSGLAKAYLLRGDLAYKNGDWSQALEMYSQSIAMFQSKNNESNPTDQNWIEYCSLRQAAAIEALGDANSKPSVLEPAGSLEPR
jgi:tetratricopeptide (TPR) repeat protein